MKKMDRMIILKALRRLGELSLVQGLHVECCMYGGALMMLAYDARVSTKDVDVVVRPRAEVLRLAAVVAGEMGLPDDWMNDQVRTFLAPMEQLRELPLEIPGVHLTAPTAGYLLAMKALACRTMLPGYANDLDDLRYLIRKMGIRSVEEIQDWIDRFYPDDVIPTPQRETLRLLIAEMRP